MMAKKKSPANGTVKSKFSGMSFSEAARMIGKRFPNRDTDPIAANGFMSEIGSLIRLQDVARQKEMAFQSIDKYRKPANASEYGDGGVLKYGPGGGLNPIDPNQFVGNPINLSGIVTGPDLSGVSYQPFGITPKIVDGGNSPKNGVGSFYPLPNVLGKGVQSITAPKLSDRLAALDVSPTATVSNSDNTSTDASGNNIYNPLIIGKSAEMLGKLALLAGGAKQVSPEYNVYEDKVRQLMASRSFNNDATRNDILAQQNTARANTAGLSSEAVRQALQTNVSNQGMQSLANNNIAMQGQNNAYAADYAQTLNNLGQQRAQANNYAEQLNNQSSGSYQQSLDNLFQSVGNVGQRLTDYNANIAQQNLLASALSTTDFQFGDVANLIKDAVNMRQIDPSAAIQIINNSKGKGRETVISEIEAAVNAFKNSF